MSALPRTYQEARWVSDLDASGAETASDLESLENDVLHILVEDYASNGADPQKGAGVLGLLNGTAQKLTALPAQIDAQLAQVDRISSSKTTLTTLSDGSYSIDIVVIVSGAVVNLNYLLGPDGLSVGRAGQ